MPHVTIMPTARAVSLIFSNFEMATEVPKISNQKWKHISPKFGEEEQGIGHQINPLFQFAQTHFPVPLLVCLPLFL